MLFVSLKEKREKEMNESGNSLNLMILVLFLYKCALNELSVLLKCVVSEIKSRYGNYFGRLELFHSAHYTDDIRHTFCYVH